MEETGWSNVRVKNGDMKRREARLMRSLGLE
jgi:hypothetical protein